MPITFNCPCGKALRVADEHAGRRVKCPACQAVGTVPAPEPEPQFEVVEDPNEQLVSPPPAPRAVAKPAAKPAVDDEDEDGRGYSVANTGRTEEDEEPRAKKKPDFRKGSGRSTRDEDDEDEDDRPRKKKGKKKQSSDENTGHSSKGTGVNAGMGGGILMMVGAVVWFVVGIVALDVIFFYPPILFIIGLVAFFKGLAGGE